MKMTKAARSSRAKAFDKARRERQGTAQEQLPHPGLVWIEPPPEMESLYAQLGYSPKPARKPPTRRTP